MAAIEVPLLNTESLTVGDLQLVVQEVVGQVNVANKAMATAGYVVAERSREALQQSKISSDLATESLLKAYEVAEVAASIARQSWKMCIVMSGPDMPPRSKDDERKPDMTGRFLATKLFGVTKAGGDCYIALQRSQIGRIHHQIHADRPRHLSRGHATCK
jgi:hypothetical protein